MVDDAAAAAQPVAKHQGRFDLPLQGDLRLAFVHEVARRHGQTPAPGVKAGCVGILVGPGVEVAAIENSMDMKIDFISINY